MRLARWKAEVLSAKSPRRRAQNRCGDRLLANQVRRDDAGGDRLRYCRARQSTQEVKDGRHQDRVHRSQYSSRNDSRYRVWCVGPTIRELEEVRDNQDYPEIHQPCLRTMLSTVFATSSSRSIAPSISSMMSFHLRTSIAL